MTNDNNAFVIVILLGIIGIIVIHMVIVEIRVEEKFREIFRIVNSTIDKHNRLVDLVEKLQEKEGE